MNQKLPEITDNQSTPPRQPRQRRRKLFFISLLGLFLLVGGIAVGGWMWLQSESFHRFVAGEIKNKLNEFGLRGEIGSFGFAWTSQTARLKDLKIYNQQTGQLIASIKDIELKTNIRDLYALKLTREIAVNQVSLNGVEIFLEVDEQGKTNLEGVHDAPPKSQALTFDAQNMQAALNNGAVYFKDRRDHFETDLNNVKVSAQLSPQIPNSVKLLIAATDSRAAFEGRQIAIGKLDLMATANESGIEIEHLNLDSAIANLKAKGKLEDFAKLHYGFDVETSVRTNELAQFAFPAVITRGLAKVTGRVEGEKDKYNFKGSVAADNLFIENTTLQGIRIPQVVATGAGDKLTLAINRVNVQNLAVDIVQINDIAVSDVKGEIKINGKKTETKFSAPSVNVASVSWPDSKLTNISLSNITSDFVASTYEVKATSKVEAGSINGAEITGATANALFDKTALSVTDIKASALGGTIEAEYTLPLAKEAPQKVKGHFANVQTAEVAALAEFKDAPVTGQVSGDVELTFGNNIRSLDGKLTARFEGKADKAADDIPLTGEIAITARDGVFNFDQFQLATDATKLNATGALAVNQAGDGQSDLRVSLTSTHAEQIIQLARSYEAARPFITQSEPQLIGDLKFEGRITGKLDDPTIEGDVTAATVGLRDALLGALSAHVVTSPTELRVENGLISATNGGSAKLNLVVPFEQTAQTGKLDAVVDRISLETILAAVGSPDASQFVSGDVSGTANLTGLPAAPRGSAQLNLVDGRIAGQPTQVARAEVTFDNKYALLQSLEIQLPKTHITASGKVNLENFVFEASGKADKIALDALAESFELTGTQVEGTADAQLQISGKFDQPDNTRKQFELDWESLKVEMNAIGNNVRVNGRDAGELRLTAHTSPGGRIETELVTGILAAVTKEKAFKPEIVKASIELRKPGRPIVIESDLTELDLSPIIATFAPDMGSQVTGAISGKLRIEGLSANEKGDTTADLLHGGMTLTSIKLNVLENPITIPTPVTIALDRSQIGLPTTHITGQGINLSLGGTFGLTDEAAMNFALSGLVNLEKLPTTQPGLYLIGEVKLDAKVTGTADKPSVSGAVDINSFGLSTQDLPIFLSNGMGRITLSGDQLKLERFVAEANDGRLEMNGAIKLVDLRPAEWKFNIKATEAEIIYDQFTATVNGTLTLVGTPNGQRLDGTISVPQGEYETRVDLDNLLGSGSSGLGFNFDTGGSSVQSSLIPPISLNLRVEARDSLLVRGKQINAVGSALFNIGGTLNDPSAFGRIETESGSVRFRGQRYEITRGTLDLPPGTTQSSVLNLIAESDLSGYHVYLDLSGPIDAIELKLRSEPQLTRDEIIALITTGRTEAGTIASQDPLRTGVGAAASLLSSGFISKPTEQLLGLSRFQIDPILRPNANPAARLTVGQQLSRNIYLTYSTNLASEQDQTALAEYTLSNRFSALATYTQGGSAARQGSREGAFTIELRGRQRFSLGFAPPLPTPTPSASGDTAANPARAKLPSAQVKVSEVPNLKLSDKTLSDLLPVMTQGFSRSLARLGERRLKEYLQEQGYFFAEVNYRCDPVDCTGSGLRVLYDIEPNQIYDLKEIRLEGTRQIGLAEVGEELQSKAESKVGGIPFLKDLPLIGGSVRGLTSSSRLSSDEETIRRRLVDLGFRSARVKSRLAFKPDNDDLVLVFDVAEGVQSDIASVVLRGNAVFDAKDLLDGVPIKSGEAFSLTRARLGAQQIRRLYADRGYLEASTELEIAEIDEDSVQLIYKISEGARAIVSDVEIKGLTKTGAGWVRRYYDFKPGDLLTPAKIVQTQRDLYATNAFREVTVRAEPVGGDDGSGHKVTINLTEAKPLLFVYGLGFSTDDGARALAEVADTNLRGSLDSLSLRLRGSRREQFAQFSFTDLRPFGSRLPTTVSFFYDRNNNLLPIVQRKQLLNGELQTINNSDQTFGLSRFAAFIQTERKLQERTSLRLRYNLERAKLFNLENVPDTEITRNERAIRLGMFSAGIVHDTRDNVLNASRGQLLSADYSLAASVFGGNESFNKFFATYQRYRTFAPATSVLKDTTLAFSARIGLAQTFRDADRNGDGLISDSEKRLPISERFFSGGATTLRGFRYETAGPQDVLFDPNQPVGKDKPFVLPTLIPVGGDALAVFNFELRYPLTQRLRLVPFYDLGNVFRRVSDIRWSGMTNTVGLGLRVNTPLGPVGVDYGFLLDPPVYAVPGVPGAVLRQPRGTLHIRFGQTF